jgi:hypothetical protein
VKRAPGLAGDVGQAAEMLTDEHELARRVELLRHQVDEITAAAAQPGEDEALERSCAARSHAEAIARARRRRGPRAARRVGGLDALATARAELAQAAALDERFAALADRAGRAGGRGVRAGTGRLPPRRAAGPRSGQPRASPRKRLALLLRPEAQVRRRSRAVIASASAAAPS